MYQYMAIEYLQGIESKTIPFMHHQRAVVNEHIQSTASDFRDHVCRNLEQIAVESQCTLSGEYAAV